MATNNTGRDGMNVGPIRVYENAAGGWTALLPNGAGLFAETRLDVERLAAEWAARFDVPCDIRG